MRLLLSGLLVSTLVLSGCGSVRDSRLNPLNWFGKSRVEAVQTGDSNPLIPQRSRLRKREIPYQGQLIDQITDLTIERVPGGAIIRTTGLAETQGAYDARLISETDDLPVKGVLTYEFRVLMPVRKQMQGPEQTRIVTLAKFLSDNQLAEVRTIRVTGARNARSSGRR